MNTQIVTRQLVIVVTLIITFEDARTSGFLLGPLGATLGYPTRNLSCPYFSSSGFNPTYVGIMNIHRKGTDYCAVIEETFLNSSSSYNKTRVTGIVFLNEYRFMAVHRCGFSPSYDIGYGTCTRLPFETADIIKLCICATTNCSISMAACQASVNQMMASSSQPPLLPVLLPRLTNTIKCFDLPSNSTSTSNSSHVILSGCDIGGIGTTVDEDACINYTKSNTVACICSGDNFGTLPWRMFFWEQSYIFQMHLIFASLVPYFNYTFEGSTNVVLSAQNDPAFPSGVCLCTTNNCNSNFSTCSNGINFSQPSLYWNLPPTTTMTTSNTVVSMFPSSSHADRISSFNQRQIFGYLAMIVIAILIK